MKLLNNRNGIALVTALMLTLISLTIVMALLYVITRGVQFSGAQKKYKTALEASYGSTEIVVKDVLPYILRNYSSPTLKADLTSTFSAVGMQVTDPDDKLKCLNSKLLLASGKWPAGCSNTPFPKQSPDLTINLAAVAGNPFTVYTKIVDTVPGNSEMGGESAYMDGLGVTEGLGASIKPQHFPYIYRIEIQGERQNNPTSQANIEVLYAY